MRQNRITIGILSAFLQSFVADEDKKYNDIYFDVKLVADSRFAYYRRLKSLEFQKRFLINALSVINIFASVAILTLDGAIVDFLPLSLIGVSLIVIWISLDKSTADILLECGHALSNAKKLNDLARCIKFRLISLSASYRAYSNIIGSSSINHDDVDHNYARYNLTHNLISKRKGRNWFNSICIYNYYKYQFSIFVITAFLAVNALSFILSRYLI